MKRRKILSSIWGLAMIMSMLLLFSSCESDEWPGGPGWGGSFYDRNLTGYWELVQVNSEPVFGVKKNYLMFGGNGYGYYYYWDNGRRMIMDTYYDCQISNSGTSNYQMNLVYGNGRPDTINYWFTNTSSGYSLWMQWREGGRVVTYVYDRINRAPW